MEKKSINLELKSIDGDNTVEGYASTFGGAPDSYGDIVVKGAFLKSLTERKVKMLWQHDMSQPIGVWDEIREDENGLYVKGRFANTPRGQEARELLLCGALDSFSIGYSVTGSDYTKEGHRLLEEVKLFEISIVTIPANDRATVTAVKSLEIKDVESLLRDAAGFSRNEAKALLAGGYKSLNALRDAEKSDKKDVLEVEAKKADELAALLMTRLFSR